MFEGMCAQVRDVLREGRRGVYELFNKTSYTRWQEVGDNTNGTVHQHGLLKLLYIFSTIVSKVLNYHF